MTFDIFCSWAGHLDHMSGTIENVNSYDELFEEMEKFFDNACGLSRVGSFEISRPYLEDWEEDDGEEPDMYEWDWNYLKRNQDLSDVWDKVKREIKKEWGKDYFNHETQK